MAIKVEVFSTSTCPHCPAAIAAAEKALNTYNKSEKSDGDLEALRDELLKYALAQN